MKGSDVVQVPDQPLQTTLLANDHDREYEIQNAVKLYANHIRELEAKGEIVIINNTNVVNNVLVHDWGKILREQLGWGNTNVQITKAKAPQDVRMAETTDKCVTVTNTFAHSMSSLQSSSPSEQSVFGGDFNRVTSNSNKNSIGSGIPGDPNGDDSSFVNRRWGGKDDGGMGERREFRLVKSSNINTT